MRKVSVEVQSGTYRVGRFAGCGIHASAHVQQRQGKSSIVAIVRGSELLVGEAS